MTDNIDKERVLSRVKKLMTLANDAAATEGERDNAMRMAHATLAKYNLSMSEAERSGAKPEEQRTGEAMEGRDYPWMRTAAYSVAQLYFCEYFYILQYGGKVKHFFIGKTSNVYTAQEMTKYIISSIDREAQKVSTERTGKSGGTYWRSFCKGAAYQVHVRCRKIREEAEEESREEAEEAKLLAAGAENRTTGTALVLASVYESEKKANTEFMQTKMGINDLRPGRGRERNTAADAHAEGRAYGDRVSLNKQIGGGSASNQRRIK